MLNATEQTSDILRGALRVARTTLRLQFPAGGPCCYPAQVYGADTHPSSHEWCCENLCLISDEAAD